MTKQPLISWTLFEGGAQDNQPDKHNGTWEELSKLLTTVNEPAKHPDPAEAKKLTPAFSETTFLDGTTRGYDNSESINLLVFDFDNCREVPTGEFHLNKKTGLPTTRPKLKKIPIDHPAQPEQVLEKLKAAGLDAVVYTTYSSSAALVKFRVVVPLAAPIPSALWDAASEWAMETLGLGAFRDSGAIDLPVLRDVARLNFLPCAPDPKSVRVWELHGNHLTIPQEVLPTYEVRELKKQVWQKPRDKKDTDTGRVWWSEFNIDFATLDLHGLLKEMGITIGKKGKWKNKDGTKIPKYRCHCIWPEEHGSGVDKDSAAFLQAPGEWPVFWCEHSIHRGAIGLREVCETAGADLVERFAKKYEAPAKAATEESNPPENPWEGTEGMELPTPVSSDPDHLPVKVKELLDKHRGAGWEPAGLGAVIREAILYTQALPASLHPYLPALFWTELAREVPLDVETMQEHHQALHEKRERDRFEREVRKHLQATTHEVGVLLGEGKVIEARALLVQEAAVIHAMEVKAGRPAPRVALEEMEAFGEYLKTMRGRDRVGLSQESLPGLDEALMGMRGLLLVAGPPNSGKTSLAVQLGLSALESESDSAVILISLEQSRWEHLTRNLAYFSELPWKTVAMGSPSCLHGAERLVGTFFEPFDKQAIKEGEERLHAIAPRFLILDDQNFGEPTPENILHEVEKLKAKTGATKVLVIVDYLQLWPMTLEATKALRTDLDRDKWQVGQLKTLRNLLGSNDAVMAISEATKQDWTKPGGLTLSSVMGSARGSYTPDVVMVIQPVTAAELNPPNETDKEKAKEEGERRFRALQMKGRAPMHFEILKGRDGVDRRAFELVFRFQILRFEESSIQNELDLL